MTTEKSLENLFLAKDKNPVKEGQAWRTWSVYVKTNSYTKFQVNISKDNCESLDYLISAKGNNSCKSSSSVTKRKLDLFYVMTKSYTTFQVNIRKKAEKSPEN